MPTAQMDRAGLIFRTCFMQRNAHLRAHWHRLLGRMLTICNNKRLRNDGQATERRHIPLSHAARPESPAIVGQYDDFVIMPPKHVKSMGTPLFQQVAPMVNVLAFLINATASFIYFIMPVRGMT